MPDKGRQDDGFSAPFSSVCPQKSMKKGHDFRHPLT
jgi:hypothetical protein